MSQQPNLSALIWSVADLLRGDLKAHEYGRVILPFTVLRRLDCVLEPTRDQVLAVAKEHAKEGEAVIRLCPAGVGTELLQPFSAGPEGHPGGPGPSGFQPARLARRQLP